MIVNLNDFDSKSFILILKNNFLSELKDFKSESSNLVVNLNKAKQRADKYIYQNWSD